MKERKETIAVRCNNPLNIRYSKHNNWDGQVGCEAGFCVFKNTAYGFRAAYKIITNYMRAGLRTIEEIVTRWAPPCENDTKRYINFVCEQTLIPSDHELTDLNIHDYWTKIIILQAMAKMESGVDYDEQMINLFINYPEKYNNQ